MSRYRIAILPGDGIGPEVMREALRVLERVCSLAGLTLEFTEHSAGAAHYQRTGEVLPAKVLEDCLQADAVFLAAIGLPDVRLPDGTEVQPVMMVGLRRALGLYAAVRPIKLYPGVPPPLRDPGPGIDFVIVRENLEGLFASFGGGGVVSDQVATDTLVITRAGTEKVVDYAFRLARGRNGRPGDGEKVVTCVDKANVFRSYAFFRKVFQEVARQHPEVRAEAVYVDALSLYLVQNPAVYDVIVTENQFGDILSDLGAGLVGGLGLAPSAEVGQEHALFQPSHGTAPQLAGRDLANPLATILSGAMLLHWLGEKHQDEKARAASVLIENAVAQVLREGKTRTADLGGTAGTKAMGDAVLDALGSM
jgi:3-isopropylmalate dehydrogenase